MWTETNEEPGQRGRIWPDWAESPKQDSWNQRKAEAAEAWGEGRRVRARISENFLQEELGSLP